LALSRAGPGVFNNTQGGNNEVMCHEIDQYDR